MTFLDLNISSVYLPFPESPHPRELSLGLYAGDLETLLRVPAHATHLTVARNIKALADRYATHSLASRNASHWYCVSYFSHGSEGYTPLGRNSLPTNIPRLRSFYDLVQYRLKALHVAHAHELQQFFRNGGEQ